MNKPIWTEWNLHWRCGDCGKLSRLQIEVCPSCGSQSINKVVARELYDMKGKWGWEEEVILANEVKPCKEKS